MLPWQPIFDRQGFFFSQNGFGYFSFNFGAFQKFWEDQQTKMADPRWLSFGEHDLNLTSHEVITSRRGPQRKETSLDVLSIF